MTKTVFPVQLAIEVDDSYHDGGDSDYTEKIELVAYVSSERQVIATTTEMSGYEAKNWPERCVKLLLQSILC